MSGGGWCLECGHHVESFEGLSACPACGTKALPCPDEWQVTIALNWHELRILVMWAENWQREKQLGRTVYAIARRLAAQHSELAKSSPLTMAGEIGQLAAQYDVQVTDSALRRDVAEQTGEELGLFRLPGPDEA